MTQFSLALSCFALGVAATQFFYADMLAQCLYR